jgi:molybdate transport system substrate-binding protein
VPIGEYSERILSDAGNAFREQVMKHVVSRELNVRQVLVKVSLGEADAAIVYRTDASTAAGKVLAIDIPGAPLAEYPIAAVSDSPLAAQFLAMVLSPEGQAVLQRFGFSPPK